MFLDINLTIKKIIRKMGKNAINRVRMKKVREKQKKKNSYHLKKNTPSLNQRNQTKWMI